MKKFITWLSMLIFISCTKNTIPEDQPNEVTIKSVEIVDLSSPNNLNTALSPAQWNLTQTQKITYSNGWINYISPGIKDRTKSFVKYTKDNKKFVEAIATDTTSKYGAGYSFHVLRSLAGLRYHSFDIRLKDMAINNGTVEKELPLYLLVKPVFTPIGTGPGTEQGKLFSCLKSRISNCGGLWKCSLGCIAILSSSTLCSVMIMNSCFPF